MDTQRATTTDQMLKDIPEESTVDQSMSMNVVPTEPATTLPGTVPAVDPGICLATPAILPRPPIITTVAAARYSMERTSRSANSISFPTPARYAHAMSHTLVTMATVKKLSKLTQPAGIAINMKAAMIHRSTALRVSKRTRCTRPVFTKKRTGAVFTSHHQS
uniref:Uncharacterized protein n=1 Tax=Romanomermis culicivorax TaxID=13658 RepID=A0A915KGF4_ROMCU